MKPKKAKLAKTDLILLILAIALAAASVFSFIMHFTGGSNGGGMPSDMMPDGGNISVMPMY